MCPGGKEYRQGSRARKMSKVCDVCGKKPLTGNTVSHANNRNKRRWMPNLQAARVLKDGRAQRIKVCTRCIRSGKITKVPHNHSGAKAEATT